MLDSGHLVKHCALATKYESCRVVGREKLVGTSWKRGTVSCGEDQRIYMFFFVLTFSLHSSAGGGIAVEGGRGVGEEL